jgi:ABC-type spermidine/putrescine transport system permease subunit I
MPRFIMSFVSLYCVGHHQQFLLKHVIVLIELRFGDTCPCSAKIELGITSLKSTLVVLNYWVFLDVFLVTLWSGIFVTVLCLATCYVIVHHASGEWLHYKVAKSYGRDGQVFT